jgi:hypothetical protein
MIVALGSSSLHKLSVFLQTEKWGYIVPKANTFYPEFDPELDGTPKFPTQHLMEKLDKIVQHGFEASDGEDLEEFLDREPEDKSGS